MQLSVFTVRHGSPEFRWHLRNLAQMPGRPFDAPDQETDPEGWKQHLQMVTTNPCSLLWRLDRDAEGSLDDLDQPETFWSLAEVLVGNDWRIGAWCAARVVTEDGQTFVKGVSNFEVPPWRHRGLYTLAFWERENAIRAWNPGLPHVTYLFEDERPMANDQGMTIRLHQEAGWHVTGDTGPGKYPGNVWHRLVRPAD